MGSTGIDDKIDSDASMWGVGSITSEKNFLIVLIGDINYSRRRKRRRFVLPSDATPMAA